MEPLMTVKEAAEYLNLSAQTLYNNVKSGKLPCIRVGRTIRFSREALDRAGVAPTKQPKSTAGPVTKL